MLVAAIDGFHGQIIFHGICMLHGVGGAPLERSVHKRHGCLHHGRGQATSWNETQSGLSGLGSLGCWLNWHMCYDCRCLGSLCPVEWWLEQGLASNGLELHCMLWQGCLTALHLSHGRVQEELAPHSLGLREKGDRHGRARGPWCSHWHSMYIGA